MDNTITKSAMIARIDEMSDDEFSYWAKSLSLKKALPPSEVDLEEFWEGLNDSISELLVNKYGFSMVADSENISFEKDTKYGFRAAVKGFGELGSDPFLSLSRSANQSYRVRPLRIARLLERADFIIHDINSGQTSYDDLADDAVQEMVYGRSDFSKGVESAHLEFYKRQLESYEGSVRHTKKLVTREQAVMAAFNVEQRS